MRKPFWLYLLVLIAVSVPPAQALAQSKEQLAAAHRLVVRSGISVQLRGMAKQMSEQIRGQAGAQLPPDMLRAFTEAALEGFRADALQEDIEKTLAGSMKIDDMQATIAWLEADLGKRIALAEELAAHTMDEENLRAYAQRLKGQPLSRKRAQLLSQVMEAGMSMDSSVRMVENMALGVALGMDSMQPVQKRVGQERLKEQLRAVLPAEQIRASLQQSLPPIMAYTYREISDPDLTAYRDFMRSPLGKRYHKAVGDAFEGAMVRASVRTGQLLEQQPAKRGT